jgi:hypothetical protein
MVLWCYRSYKRNDILHSLEVFVGREMYIPLTAHYSQIKIKIYHKIWKNPVYRRQVASTWKENSTEDKTW